MAMNTEVRELVRKLKKQGWTVEEPKRGHPRVRPPGGGDFIMLPSTPKGGDWLKGKLSELRKAGFEG